MTPIASSKQPRNLRASCHGERGMQGGGSGIAVIVLAQVRQRRPPAKPHVVRISILPQQPHDSPHARHIGTLIVAAQVADVGVRRMHLRCNRPT